MNCVSCKIADARRENYLLWRKALYLLNFINEFISPPNLRVQKVIIH